MPGPFGAEGPPNNQAHIWAAEGLPGTAKMALTMPHTAAFRALSLEGPGPRCPPLSRALVEVTLELIEQRGIYHQRSAPGSATNGGRRYGSRGRGGRRTHRM